MDLHGHSHSVFVYLAVRRCLREHSRFETHLLQPLEVLGSSMLLFVLVQQSLQVCHFASEVWTGERSLCQPANGKL